MSLPLFIFSIIFFLHATVLFYYCPKAPTGDTGGYCIPAVNYKLKRLFREFFMCAGSYFIIRMFYLLFGRDRYLSFIKLPQVVLLLAADILLYNSLSELTGSSWGALTSVFLFAIVTGSVYFGVMGFRPERLNYSIFIMVFYLIFHNFSSIGFEVRMLIAGFLCGIAVLIKAPALIEAAVFFGVVFFKGIYGEGISGVAFFLTGAGLLILPVYIPGMFYFLSQYRKIRGNAVSRDAELRDRKVLCRVYLVPLCLLQSLNIYKIMFIFFIAAGYARDNYLLYSFLFLWFAVAVIEALAQDFRHFFARIPWIPPYCMVPACCFSLIDVAEGGYLRYWTAFFPLVFSWRLIDQFNKKSLNLEKHYRNINELALLFREEKYGGNAFSKPGPVLLLDDSPQFYAVSCREPVLEIEYLWYTNLRCAGDWRSIVLEAISVKKPAYILVSRREDAVFDAGGLFRETGMIYLRENCREAEKSGMDLFVFRASVVSSGSGEGRAGHGIFNNLPSPSEFSALKQVKFKKLGDHIRADGGDYALFGCGNFTSGLLDYLMGNHIKLPSVIYDDNPSVQEFRTVPVLPASEIKNSAFPVILSSDIFNTRVMMYFSLSRSGCQPGRIKDIYTFLGGKELSFQDE